MFNPIRLVAALGAVPFDEGGFGGTSGPDLTRYLIVVGILIVAILACSVLARKVIAGSHRLRSGQRDLQVLDVLPLGGKRQMSVVRCYDRTFALGLGERDVALIAELDPSTTQVPVKTTAAADVPERDFMRLFEVARERLRKAPQRRVKREREPEEVNA